MGVAIAIAVAGTWGYGALARREDDSGRAVRLLAIAENYPTLKIRRAASVAKTPL